MPADFRTKFSIFLLSFGSISSRCSAFMRMVAYSIACFLKEALVHSITAEVRMGTVSNTWRIP